MRLNRTSEWKVMTIWISQEVLLFNFKRLDILCARFGDPCEKLWPFEFLESLRCLISSVSIYYAPESNIRVKIYDHLNFSRPSVVKFRVSRYIMLLNWTSMWKLITIGISREHRCSIASVSIYYVLESYIRVKSYLIWISRKVPLCNFEGRDILCSRIGHPCKKLWPFAFLESFRCQISSVSIYYASESDIQVKIFDWS